ncbi:hypothetical protein G7Y89_g6948 [Cudoniella acicularis]|uniref:Peptidase S8/S53 domain-containing protein n=1 Tax=Cudoniella acicularis TaxID=354080 RepID=A0A8H4W510_9HELO|nr:hypothetical protein G7Y89_g6948 [Cudoniella acicularis]
MSPLHQGYVSESEFINKYHEAKLAFFCGKYELAIYLFQEADHLGDQCSRYFEVDSDVVQSISLYLAKSYYKAGRFSKAEEECRKVLSSLEDDERDDGNSNIVANIRDSLCLTRGQLALILSKLGKWDEAFELHKINRKAREELFGPESLDVLWTQHGLAETYFDMGNFEEAARLDRDVLQKAQVIAGEDQDGVIESRNNLAKALYHLQDFAEAQKLLQQNKGFIKRKIGEKNGHIYEKELKETETWIEKCIKGREILQSKTQEALPSEETADTQIPVIGKDVGPQAIESPGKQATQSRADSDKTNPSLFDAQNGKQDKDLERIADRWFDRFEKQTLCLLEEKASSMYPKVKIAILDTGIAMSSREKTPKGIRGNQYRIKYQSFEESKIGNEDIHGHGTHAATLLLKIAPQADICVARVLQGTERSINPKYVAEAIKYAIDVWHVDIITISFGYWIEDNMIEEIILKARASKVLVFAAASNEGVSRPESIAFPARLSTVMCVNSANGDGTSSSFNPKASDDCWKFSALGEAVKSAWPPEIGEGEEKRQSGTSVATPIAATTAALILEFARQPPLDQVPEVGEWLKTFEGIREVLKLMSEQPDVKSRSCLFKRTAVQPKADSKLEAFRTLCQRLGDTAYLNREINKVLSSRFILFRLDPRSSFGHGSCFRAAWRRIRDAVQQRSADDQVVAPHLPKLSRKSASPLFSLRTSNTLPRFMSLAMQPSTPHETRAPPGGCDETMSSRGWNAAMCAIDRVSQLAAARCWEVTVHGIGKLCLGIEVAVVVAVPVPFLVTIVAFQGCFTLPNPLEFFPSSTSRKQPIGFASPSASLVLNPLGVLIHWRHRLDETSSASAIFTSDITKPNNHNVEFFRTIVFLWQIGYVWHLFSNKDSDVQAAAGVGSHFIFNNLLQIAFVLLFVESHFFWAEIILIINFFNLSFLYFRHNTAPRLIHIPAVAGPLAWTFVALYWDGAIAVNSHSWAARVVANVAVWGFLVYGLFYLFAYKDYTIGFALSVLTAALGVGQFFTKFVALQWIFAFTIMGVLFLVSLLVSVPLLWGKEFTFRREVASDPENQETAPLLNDQ